jgi:hypothetical protein
MYAISLGASYCWDNEYLIGGDYGRSIEFGVTGVRIISEGLCLDTEQTKGLIYLTPLPNVTAT